MAGGIFLGLLVSSSSSLKPEEVKSGQMRIWS